MKHKASRRKEMININRGINKIEIRNILQKSNKTKSYFVEMINKMTNLGRKEERKLKLLNQELKGDFTIGPTETEGFKGIYEQLHANKLDN